MKRVGVVGFRALCLLVLLGGFWLARPANLDIEDASPQIVQADRAAVPAPAPHSRARLRRVAQHHVSLEDRRRALARLRRRLQLKQQALALLHQNLWLHGVGTQLYTAWQAPITLKAINWYGFEYAPFVPGGLDRAPLDAILSTLHGLGFNALRLTFANATVEWNPVVRVGVDANPRLYGLHSLDIMQRIIERAHHFGLRVILCNSRSEPGMGPEIKSGLWFTNEYPDSAWRADWVTLVTRFRKDSAFVGADLRNEPHIVGSTFDLQSYFKYGPLWGAFNGTYYYDRDWRYAAETLGNALLRINPNLLIIVEGVQMYLDPDRNKLTGALWGSNLIGVQYDQVTLSRPSQLVYSVHEYGPKMYQAAWFNPNTTYDSLAARWDHHWGYLLSAPRFMQAPILVGEFGTCDNWHACISDPHKPWSQGFWFSSFVQYMKLHPQVGWAYWSLNPEGPFNLGDDNFYSLMTHDWQKVHPMLVRGLQPLLQEPNG